LLIGLTTSSSDQMSQEKTAPVQNTADATTPRMQHNMLCPENVFKREREREREREATTQPVLQGDCREMPQDNQQPGCYLRCPQGWQAILKTHSGHKELARRALKSKTYGASTP
jgi:hypothetical protein